MMETATSTRLRGFSDERGVGLLERSGFLRMDPYIAAAAIALIATSVVVLAFTTKGDVTGNPYFYVIRQSIYGVVGVALMLALTRIDYSRFRELRVGIYTAMIASITARSAARSRRARLAALDRASLLHAFSRPSSASFCSSSPWPASSSTGPGGSRRRRELRAC